MMRSCLIGLCVVLWAVMPSHASDVTLSSEVFAGQRTHAIMRHALAPGYSDPANFDVDDCATQRNLNEDGRWQARETGSAFRDAGVSFDAVWTSQWCRCIDTATLLDVGDPFEVPALNSFFEDRSSREAQTEALRAQLQALPADQSVMMVTHQVNISALLGRSTTSGEVVIFSMDEDGAVTERDSFVVSVR